MVTRKALFFYVWNTLYIYMMLCCCFFAHQAAFIHIYSNILIFITKKMY
jgi:hypothetical protein